MSGRKRGRRVILHELDYGLTSSFRFLDPRDRGFIACAGCSRREAGELARKHGLRIEWREREEG